LKPDQANSSERPYLDKPFTKINRAGGVAQGAGPEFKPQYHTHTHTHTKKKLKNK
jgi:hypothetical protein